MKRYLFSTIAVIVVLAITVGLYAQPGAGGGQGMGRGGAGMGMGGPGGGMGFGGGMRRGGMVMLRAQTAEPAIAAIEAELKKLKDIIAEGGGGFMGMRRGEGGEMPSQEEMQKMMEDMQKRSETTVAALDAISDQLKVLKGGNVLQSELQESNNELAAIQQIATEEKAEKTAKAIEDLIAKRQQALQDSMDTLGIRGGRGGMMGGRGGMGAGARGGGLEGMPAAPRGGN